VEGFIASAREEGATILTGGKRPSHLKRGYYVEPTLIADVTSDMKVVREEVFGPVITLQSYSTVDEAVALTNDTRYGLANVIITNDGDRAVELAPRLRSGTVSINNFGSCMTAPFGGFGDSGVGREGGKEGLEAFFEYQQIQFPAAN
jgi:aldehyde dehydrogenase (NAD+)